MIDWSTTLFRASSIGTLMTEPRSKSESLSETTRTYLKQLYREKKYSFRKIVKSKYFDKGNLCEEEGITVYSRYKKRMFKKNSERINSEYFTGEPDFFDGPIITEAEWIYDNKASWDAFTFPFPDDKLDKNYKYQGLTYCELTGAKGATFAFTLVDTPEHLVQKEIKSILWETGEEATEKEVEFIKFNMTFSDKMSIEERVCEFVVNRDDEEMGIVKERTKIWRDYLKFLDEPKIILV